jgi:hypothetical protein
MDIAMVKLSKTVSAKRLSTKKAAKGVGSKKKPVAENTAVMLKASKKGLEAQKPAVKPVVATLDRPAKKAVERKAKSITKSVRVDGVIDEFVSPRVFDDVSGWSGALLRCITHLAAIRKESARGVLFTHSEWVAILNANNAGMPVGVGTSWAFLGGWMMNVSDSYRLYGDDYFTQLGCEYAKLEKKMRGLEAGQQYAVHDAILHFWHGEKEQPLPGLLAGLGIAMAPDEAGGG